MIHLATDPETRLETMGELVAVAHALEIEAVRRYEWLATELERRGEDATAEALRALAAEETTHVREVEGWAAGLGEAVPTGTLSWRLPSELAASWDDAAGSTLLTPYRALAIAVDNEERAFAFYTYLAARAASAPVAAEAEKLAREELRHAALLRTWRRAAWRRERGHAPSAQGRGIESAADLAALVARQEQEIARDHRALADRLGALGDGASAALLAELAGAAAGRPGTAPGTRPEAAVDRARAASLLRDAERPLERLSEILEDVLAAPAEEAVMTTAQEALARVVARIARIGRRIEQLEAA